MRTLAHELGYVQTHASRCETELSVVRQQFEQLNRRFDPGTRATSWRELTTLDHVLLVARVLTRRERRGRTIRALGLSARFVEGGTWRTRVTLRQPSAEPDRIRKIDASGSVKQIKASILELVEPLLLPRPVKVS